jgi:TIR domain
VAAKLRAGLESAGLQVLDQTRLGEGEPWSDALRRMVTQSDAIVGLVGEDEISPWVSAEIKAAVASSKPALVLLANGASSAGLPGDVRTLEIDVNRLDSMAIAESLRSW